MTVVDFSKSITQIVLQGPSGNSWDTIPNNPIWVVGVARGLDNPLENQTNGSVNFPVGNTGLFKLFASNDANSQSFVQGAQFTVTVTFSDSTTATASATVSQTAAVDLSIVNLAAHPSPAIERQNIDYTIRIINNGTELATGVKLTHQFVNYEVYDSGGVSNNSGAFGRCTPDNVKVTCTIGNPFGSDLGLAPGEAATIDIIVYFRKASDP
ncbi:MAG TPA: hypothetical protein DCK99_08690, partial [Blastocatellia bacterium]|nr:hypothetical protein [Blastocatellia bacterium]